MMNKDEAVQELAKVARISVAYAEDLYDSFFPKPVVPQCVADWYEEHKDEFYLNLHRVVWDFLERLSAGYFNKNPIDYDFACWYYNTKNAIQTLVNMHQFGYEVEKEKRYYVRFKGMESGDFNYLNFIKFQHAWVLSSIKLDKNFRTEHTKKQLEEAGFGWVLDCPGVEVKEVE